ncbi:MAG TPA: AAA family ATPase [bacterium]|nr:AAA family ATPase [bacterium]HQL61100.1 AAA family ATPase [bacterium]
MLKRIRIQGYKSIRDLDIKLTGLSVLFGPNASGKSNLLDALQLLSRIATSRTLKEAFEPPYRGKPLESFAFGPEGIRGLLDQEAPSFTLEADIELSPATIDSVNRRIREMNPSKANGVGKAKTSASRPASFVREKFLRYRISVEILPKSGVLRVADEYLAALNTQGEPTRKRLPFLERDTEKDRLHLRFEGQAHPTYYDRYLDHSILSMPHYPPHYPHLVAMQRELASWLFFYFEPRERMRAKNPVKEVRHIGLMGEDLASFLNTLKSLNPRQFNAVEKALRMVIPEVTGIEVKVSDLGEVELVLREGDIPIPAGVVSEGTLRVLGLLALEGVKELPALIGFEEPENGIHPRRIQMIAELLKTRSARGETQLIVTTHSPILPDRIPDESLYVCQKQDGCTRIDSCAQWGKGELWRDKDIQEGLDGLMSERILRGISMREIRMFVEDFGHQEVVGGLVRRLAQESGIEINLKILNASGGSGMVLHELQRYVRDLQTGNLPDLLIAAIDANCQGITKRRNEILNRAGDLKDLTVCALPNPHIERWLLIDSAAFKKVLGAGCWAPGGKCERDRYKHQLLDAVRESGVLPIIGGMEHAKDIVLAMDLNKVKDRSLGRFLKDLRNKFSDWQR